MLTILVFYMVILVTMVYGPIAAFLVELFPARIRYTSMSLPYHVGNGVFGGLVPAAGASIAAITGIALSGLFYPMAIAAIGVVVSLGLPPRADPPGSGSGTKSGAARRRSSRTSLSSEAVATGRSVGRPHAEQCAHPSGTGSSRT